MNAEIFERIEPIADAVMYEGYVLYPYRASAIKNCHRWQFGLVTPRAYSETTHADPWYAQTECLVEPASAPHVTVKVRCLQLQHRLIEEWTGGRWRGCDRAVANGRELLTWDEAVPRAVVTSAIPFKLLCEREQVVRFDLDEALEREVVRGPGNEIAARITRQRWPLSAVVRLTAQSAGELVKLRVRVENATAYDAGVPERAPALRLSLLGCHTLLHVEGARFISLMDPPAHAAAAAASCLNEHTWPVLAGAAGARDLMLSAPIILYDYPAVAPESPHSFFDATEIDELLALRVMTMTDGEQREARATDDRVAALVDSAGEQDAASLAHLHGAIRSFEELLGAEGSSTERAFVDVGSVRLEAGSRVVLAPQKRADSMDMFLAGRTATIAMVHRDLEDRVYLAVTVDDDPAADLHLAYGRFFYFAPEDVRPLEVEETAADDAQ